MPILGFQVGSTGLVGVNPRIVQIQSNDTYAAVTAAGYLNGIIAQGFALLATDEIHMNYGTNSASFAVFLPSFSAGIVTLAPAGEGVILPVVSGHVAQFSGTTGTLTDSGIAIVNLQTSLLSSPDAISDLVWHDVTCGFAALATAGKVNIQVSTSTKQYIVRDIRVNASTGLSGGGGDRLLAISDGTTVYNNAGITAALLGTPINTVWGGTGNPVPATSVAFSKATAAGATLFAQYAGGTTDYTAGLVIISVLTQRVA